MKKYLFVQVLLIIFLFNACEEDIREPLISEGIAPGKISNVVVENLPGGAALTYTLPNDNDLLYVLAEYEFGNGDNRRLQWINCYFDRF